TVVVMSTVAAVMVPPLSRVRFNVIALVPLAEESALVTAGTSLAGNICAVNRAVVGNVGPVGVSSPPHAKENRARAIRIGVRRFISIPFFGWRQLRRTFATG